MLTNKHIKHWCYRHSNISTLTQRSNRTKQTCLTTIRFRENTLPKINSSPLKIGPKGSRLLFQPSIFRCENVHVRFRETIQHPLFFVCTFLLWNAQTFLIKPTDRTSYGGPPTNALAKMAKLHDSQPFAETPSIKDLHPDSQKERWCGKHLAKWLEKM